jgi:hypothetical protein
MNFEKFIAAFQSEVISLRSYDDVMDLANELINQITFLGSIISEDEETFKEYIKSIVEHITGDKFNDAYKALQETDKAHFEAKKSTLN